MSENELTTISPEGLEVAQAYLSHKQDIQVTADVLRMPIEKVAELLDKRETQRYIDRIFNESGFRNRERMGAVMDEIIAQKLEEMDETGLGSSKDIIEILKLSHDMKMKEMEMQIKLLAAEKGSVPAVAITNNTQNNYNSLLEKIANASK